MIIAVPVVYVQTGTIRGFPGSLRGRSLFYVWYVYCCLSVVARGRESYKIITVIWKDRQ